MLNEILNDDVKLVGVREGKTSFHEHILRFIKRKFQGTRKRASAVGFDGLYSRSLRIFEKSLRSMFAFL